LQISDEQLRISDNEKSGARNFNFVSEFFVQKAKISGKMVTMVCFWKKYRQKEKAPSYDATELETHLVMLKCGCWSTFCTYIF